ncbi:MAG: DUF3365 domain-containing protein [Deltaproteobacteria bacterium]|nr:DUF3365 domain-containing protein [Deltaproteobacteria bacterium]
MKALGAIALGLALAACRSDEPAPVPGVQEAIDQRAQLALMQRAQVALGPFKKELKATLEGALAKGPEAAIAVCAEVAPELAKRASTGGVTVGRTSDRLRNPRNTAPAWLAPMVKGLDEPKVVRLDGGRVGYAEPIVLQDMCTMCHGKDLAPAIAERLKATYPDDAATGYAAGDVRGAFWAELTVEP